VAYAINTTATDLQNVLVNVTSPNVVELFVDGKAVAQSQANGAAAVSGFATIPAFSPTQPSTRIVLKVLQRPGDQQFGFSVSLQSQNNVPLTNDSGELVLRLDPTGGI
jgi:hypothetical protein